MEKVQLVLLKKNGGGENEDVGEGGLKKYKDLYKDALSEDFIQAISEMVVATAPRSTGGKGLKISPLTTAAPAVV